MKWHLYWAGKEVGVDNRLVVVESEGVRRMEDFQKSGFPLTAKNEGDVK